MQNEIDRTIIKVTDIIGSKNCISSDDGQMVFDIILDILKNGMNVTISFDGVTKLVSLFLHVAIGQLYGQFSEEEIRSRVKVEGLSGDDLKLLECVVNGVKKYNLNPKGYFMQNNEKSSIEIEIVRKIFDNSEGKCICEIRPDQDGLGGIEIIDEFFASMFFRPEQALVIGEAIISCAKELIAKNEN